MASMSPESQHKVQFCALFCMTILMMSQLLAANLEEADPAVYKILQRVRCPCK